MKRAEQGKVWAGSAEADEELSTFPQRASITQKTQRMWCKQRRLSLSGIIWERQGNVFNSLTWGNLRLMEMRAPSGSLASSESRTACTVVALGWWVSASTCNQHHRDTHQGQIPAWNKHQTAAGRGWIIPNRALPVPGSAATTISAPQTFQQHLLHFLTEPTAPEGKFCLRCFQQLPEQPKYSGWSVQHHENPESFSPLIADGDKSI